MSAHDSDSDDPLIGTLVSDRYRVLRKLGEGGMGRVYEAQHEGIGKKVALKCLNAEYATHPVVVERFKREARAATAVGNEHIVDVTDLGDLPDGSPFIVMEHLEGRELAALIDQGPLTLGRAVRILDQVCGALAAAHAKGIVHRDLKPENIFLISRGGNADFVKVLDFGISKMREPEETAPSLTRTGMAMGTPQYMSPEQAQGKLSTDHRTDVYALGVILYRMLTGKVPFSAESFPMLIVAIVTQDAPSVLLLRPELPSAMDGIVRRALARDVDERFQSVTELALALAPFRHVEDAPRIAAPVPTTRLSLEGTVPGKPAPKRAALTEARPSAAPTVGGMAGAADSPAQPSAWHEGRPSQSVPQAVPQAVPQSVSARTATPVSRPVALPEPVTSPAAATRMEADVARGSRLRLPAVLAGLGLSAVALVLWLQRPAAPESTPADGTPPTVIETPEPSQAPTAVVREPATPEESPEVRVRIAVQPAGARIFLDDREFPNPLDSPRPRSLDPVRVRMELEGHETLERMIVFDSDARLEMTLQPSSGRPRSSMGGTTGTAHTASPVEAAMMDTPPTPMDGFRDDFE